MKVTGLPGFKTLDVVGDATGLSSRAGTALPASSRADWALWAGCRRRWQERGSHAQGMIRASFSRIAVVVADGGECVSDLAELRGQPASFGDVACGAPARARLPAPVQG